jgi:hypothetical protein
VTKKNSPLGAVIRGMVAGAVGTVAMDLVHWLRARRGGNDQSFVEYDISTGSVDDFDDASAPGKLGKRVVEGVFHDDVPSEMAGPMSDLMHWSTGIGYGALHGLVAGSIDQPKVSHGIATGVGAFANSYTILPLTGLYQPLWEYDAQTVYKDLSAHVVYGIATAATFKLLTRSG